MRKMNFLGMCNKLKERLVTAIEGKKKYHLQDGLLYKLENL
jgi:hypothetical protein